MVCHHMSFYYLYTLPFTEVADILLNIRSQFDVYQFSSEFWTKYYVVLAHPLRMC